MGCTTSSAPMDAQAMLEKQREIMLQRQKEFEAKRQLQQQQQANGNGISGLAAELQVANKVPASIATRQQGGVKTSSTQSSPATPLKPGPQVGQLSKLDGESSSRPPSRGLQQTSANATTTTNTNERIPSLPSKKDEPSSTAASAKKDNAISRSADDETSQVQEIEARARRYTVDQNDVNARRSKNVHDFSMYAKDVTRRASFNPRPKESPFTPEMQAMMRAGHEAMMKSEAEKKMQRMAETGDNGNAVLPAFEEEDAAAARGTVVNDKEPVENDKGADENKDQAEEAAEREAAEREAKLKEAKEKEDFDLDIEEARKKEQEAKNKDAEVPGVDDPNVSKYLAKDNVDRKSKNVHDLGQYFNRRASFVPDAPGQQRRASFQPQNGAMATRRASFQPNAFATS